MAQVFVSHASADLPVAVEVLEWLRAEGHEVFLDRNLADGLRVGEAWKQQLYAELRRADAVVCLVSEAFLACQLGQPLTTPGGVTTVTYSPDGKTLTAATDGGAVEVRLWDVAPVTSMHADPVRVACQLSRSGLTRDDWNRYVPGFPYYDTCTDQ